MFDIGFWEFALIGVIVLVVVGPERMPEFVKTTGKYVGKIKRIIVNAKYDIGKGLEDQYIKQHLHLDDEKNSIIKTIKDTEKSIKAANSEKK